MPISTPRELWLGYCEAVPGIRERFGLFLMPTEYESG
jgi:hypothetical protein